ncbi:penicillin-binding protein activator [candidate division TA06 bacterium]|uniref:Penicillin-binding protein activator n=1 Tax=candidate division TA06 bacterium TaxID=2250710 RepID=A0A933MJJ4_UNCT6|nr:penicillin-binding protein activator [candidate division TA06 bacterium]
MKKYGVILLCFLAVSCQTFKPAVDKKTPVSKDQQAKEELRQKKETEAAGILDKAKSQYSERKPAEAAETLQQLLARYPETASAVEALYLTALYRFEIRQIDLALQNGFKLTDKYPDSELWVKTKKVLGDCYTENRDYVKAGQQYLEGMAKAKAPEGRETLRLPLLSLINEKLSAGELRILYKAYSDAETAPAMGLRLCKLELEAKNVPEAKKLLSDLSKKYPGSGEAGTANLLLSQLSGDNAIIPAVPVEKKIGLLAPLSGKFGEFGQAVQNGVELAFEEYNQTAVEKFKLVAADSKGDAIDAVKQTRYLADSSKVMGLIGEVLSGATIAAAGVADALGVPLLSPTATDDRISTIGPCIFQLNPSLSWQGPAVAQYAVKARGFKALAMLYPDEGAWESVAQAFAKEAAKLGARLVYSQSYTPGATDFQVQIDRLRLVKVDALFLPASPSDIVMIAPQLAYNQMKLQLLGPESWGDPKVAAQGDVYVEGAIFAVLSEGSELAQSTAAFEERFKKRYGKPPSKQAAQGYDAARIMIAALQKNPASRQELQTYLNSGDFTGLKLSGQGSFGRFGAQPKAKMMTIKNRQAAELGEDQPAKDKKAPAPVKNEKAKADSAAKKAAPKPKKP